MSAKELLKKSSKSSKEEDIYYKVLWSENLEGNITHLQRQVEFKAVINEIQVFKYTADFVYKDWDNNVIVEEYKGHIFERHDSILRIKVLSALYPDFEFRIRKKKAYWRIYKAGKAIRVKTWTRKSRRY